MWRESLLATNTGTFPRIKRIPSRRLRSVILWHIFLQNAIAPRRRIRHATDTTDEPMDQPSQNRQTLPLEPYHKCQALLPPKHRSARTGDKHRDNHPFHSFISLFCSGNSGFPSNERTKRRPPCHFGRGTSFRSFNGQSRKTHAGGLKSSRKRSHRRSECRRHRIPA